jgi:hypothetical protein
LRSWFVNCWGGQQPQGGEGLPVCEVAPSAEQC